MYWFVQDIDQKNGWTLDTLQARNKNIVAYAKQVDGSVQERCNSSALTMGLRLSCTNPSKCAEAPFSDWDSLNLHQIWGMYV